MAAANRSRSPRPSCRWRDAAWKSTVSCFEDEPLPGFAKALAAAFNSGFEDFGLSAAVVACLPREDFVKRFAIDAFLLMAISPSLMSTTASSAATDTSPAPGLLREGAKNMVGDPVYGSNRYGIRTPIQPPPRATATESTSRATYAA